MCMVIAVMALGLAEIPAAPEQPPLVLEERVTGDGARTQVFTVNVHAPQGDVWAALTTAEGWKRWAVPAAWQRSSNPLVIETSYDPKAAPDGPQTIKQQFDRLDPPRSLSFRTVKAPEGFPGLETYKAIISTFTLTSKVAGTTRITFETGPFPDTDEGRRLYGFFRDGNRLTLERLARVLSKGEAE